MFDIGWSELLVIGIVALVVIGPKELPGVVRSVAQNIAKLRRMASDFQNQFTDAMREMELHDLKKDAEKLLTDTKSSFDPVKNAGEEIKKAMEEPALMAPAAEAEKPVPVSAGKTAAASDEKPKSEQDRGA
jgi:sec-independent protein translocase protein TatB